MSPRHRIPSCFVLVLSTVALLVGLMADAGAAPSGKRLWARIVADVATFRVDNVIDVAPGPNGSVYACGVYDFPLYSGYLWVARYSAAGHRMWLKKYGAAQGIDANAEAMTVDGKGNLIVTGRAVAAGNENMLTLKYAPNGARLWARQYDGVGGGQDHAHAVVTDGAGNVYIAGASTGMGTGLDYLTVKYSAGGVYRWEARYVGPGVDDVPYAIAIDGSRNTYVTGTSQTTSGDTDSLTMKVGPDGARRWARRYAGPDGHDDGGHDIAVRNGNVHVSGATTTDAGGTDILLLKYSVAGAPKWTRTWDGPAHQADHSSRLAVDALGNEWIVGDAGRAGGLHSRALLIKWDPAGHRRWTRTYSATGIQDSTFVCLAVDAGGRAWCAGWRAAAPGSNDVLVVKYTPGGLPVWARTWNGPGNGQDGAGSICLSGSTGLYVGGWCWRPATNTDPVLLKYVR